MIRIDAVWLAVEPIDIRAGAERLLASVVKVFGSAGAPWLQPDDILSKATAAVGPSYFTLAIAGGEAVFRERVYCHELYHQRRQL